MSLVNEYCFDVVDPTDAKYGERPRRLTYFDTSPAAALAKLKHRFKGATSIVYKGRVIKRC